ncbi:L-aminoadipate-semialdehyde dehydrogenase-phosphopantetheinyl transferase [Leptopilina heterotoma]|uniref:L-aminoadipate-semialdehyde dehydrogenase-phosphopantetheinyl transferase n=1 Tax=Leptopilina heterotoma TaxID=63436 RepID=UPI001CA8A761|nr:L-aminoadipate-semialdehyde dehydrogenase-phosphopantetheinyl transferase [Leptopilina heterotoma]
MVSVRWAFNWANWHPTEKEFMRLMSYIQVDEKERLGKFVFRKDVKASLIGRLMIRKFVSEYACVPYNEVVFTRDDHNKPIYENANKSLAFNVSHQGNFTVLAGETRNVKLGTDVMKLEYTGGKRLSEFFRLMDKNFSSIEWAEIKGGASESAQIAMFCRHWALKESYVKALGVGIVIDLRKIEFRTISKLSEDNVVTDTSLYLNNVKQNWIFEESLLNSEHCVAVATENSNLVDSSKTLLFGELTVEKLVENAIPLIEEDPEYCSQYFAKSERP